ncbi:MAG: AAA family ATPase [Bryobacteraceae bacterium]
MSKNILVICPERRLMGDLIPLLSQHYPSASVEQVTQYPDRKTVSQLLSQTRPLCFVDVTSDQEKSLALLADMGQSSPSTVIVALLSANNSDLILRALRQGAAEFLLQPFSVEQLQPVMERAFSSGPGSIGTGTILSVIPVKGACGASTLASSLVFQAKRTGAKTILLADLDPTAGTLSFLLKVKSNYSFLDALSRAGNLDADLWRGMVTQHKGVDVLLSPENAMDAVHDLPDPREVVEFCRQAYDYVILDLSNPFTRWSQSILAQSDEILLVTTNELPALRSTQRALQHLSAQGVDKSRIRLVVNRYNPDVGLNQEAIETALRNKVFRIIPSDYESVQRALMEGKPISPSSGFGKSLAALANQLFEPPKGAQGETAKKKSSWTSIFSSLISRS